VPLEARAHTEAGAEAFVRFYIDQLNLAWTSPRTGLLPPLSEPGCKSCAAFERTARGLVLAGHRYSNTPVSVTSVNAYGGAPAGEQLLRFRGVQNTVDIVDRPGGTVSTDRLEPIVWDVLLGWTEGSWRVLDLG
jgi:hypothetical protein